MFVNDKIYHRVTSEERAKLHATLKDSKFIKVVSQTDSQPDSSEATSSTEHGEVK
jgi:hypothetical protein